MTEPTPNSPDEPARIEALRACNLVDAPLDERFERIMRLALRMLKVSFVGISLVDADRKWFKSIQGLDVEETGRDVPFCGHTILGSEAMIVPDARCDERFAANPLVTGPPHIRFYAGCPVRAIDGTNIGTFCVIDPEPREPNREDIEALRDLAGMVEAEIRHSSSNAVHAMLLDDMNAEMRRSLVDPLTRVWGREGILGVAEEAIDRTAKGQDGAALVMVDLDRFKQVNDSYGHAAGDEVLRVCARRMVGALREGDVVGRLSGDEFLLVLCPCESADAAETVTERVRVRLVETPVRCGGASIDVSASFGVRFVDRGNTQKVASILEFADRALYDSKRGGRNRVNSRRPAA